MKSTTFVLGLLLLSSYFLTLNANQLKNEGDLSEDAESDSFLVNFGQEGKRGSGESGVNDCGTCVFGKCENQVCVCTAGWSEVACTTATLSHTPPLLRSTFTVTGPSLDIDDHVTWTISPAASDYVPSSDVSSFTVSAGKFSPGTYTITGVYTNTKGTQTLTTSAQFIACDFGTVEGTSCKCREGFSGAACNVASLAHSAPLLCKDFNAYAPAINSGESILWTTNFGTSFTGSLTTNSISVPVDVLAPGTFSIGFTITSPDGTSTASESVTFAPVVVAINMGGQTTSGNFYPGNSIYAVAQIELPGCDSLPSSYTYEWSSSIDSNSIFASSASMEFLPFTFAPSTSPRIITFILKNKGTKVAESHFTMNVLSLPNEVIIEGAYIQSTKSESVTLTSKATNPDVSSTASPVFTYTWTCHTELTGSAACGDFFVAATKTSNVLALTSVPVGVYTFTVTASSTGKAEAVSSVVVYKLAGNAPSCSAAAQQPNPALTPLQALSGSLTAVRSTISSESAIVSTEWTVSPPLGTPTLTNPHIYLNIPSEAACGVTHTFLLKVTNSAGGVCYAGTNLDILCAPTGGQISGDTTGKFYTQLATFSTEGWSSTLPLTYVWSIAFENHAGSTLLSSGIFNKVSTFIVPPSGVTSGTVKAVVTLSVADSAGRIVKMDHNIDLSFETAATTPAQARAIVDNLNPTSLLQELFNPSSGVTGALSETEKTELIAKSVDNIYTAALNSVGGLSPSLFNTVVNSLSVAGPAAKEKISNMLDHYPAGFPISNDVVLTVLKSLKPASTKRSEDVAGKKTQDDILKVANLMHGGVICGAPSNQAAVDGVASIDTALLGAGEGYSSATFSLPEGVTSASSPDCFTMTLVDFSRDFTVAGTAGKDLTSNATRVIHASITPGNIVDLPDNKRIELTINISESEEANAANLYAAYRQDSTQEWVHDEEKTTLVRRRGGKTVIVTDHLTEFTIFLAQDAATVPVDNLCKLQDTSACHTEQDAGFCWNADSNLVSGDGFCNCYSGWGGNQCQIANIPHTESAVDVSAGSFLPQFELTTGTGVTFTVKIPSVVGPNTVQPTGSSYGTGTFLSFFEEDDCNYPNYKEWQISTSSDGNFDIYTANFEYVDLVNKCGLKKYDIPGYLIYNSTLSIARHFKIVSGPFSLSRTASISQKFQIQFPTTVSVTATVKVVDNTVTEFSTLTGSIYDPSTELWTFTFATATVAPYKLSFASSGLVDPNTRVKVADLTSISNCQDSGSICQQSFELKATDCNALHYKLKMRLNVECRTGATDCVKSATPLLEPTFEVTTSASCPVSKDSDVTDPTVVAFRGTSYDPELVATLFGKSESIAIAYGFKSAAVIDTVELLSICIKEKDSADTCTSISESALGDITISPNTQVRGIPLYVGFSVTGSQINDIVPVTATAAKQISIRIDSRVTYKGIGSSKRSQYVSSDVGANIVISIADQTPSLEENSAKIEASAPYTPSAAVSFHSVSLVLIAFVLAFLL
jgi:hypothetical protein